KETSALLTSVFDGISDGLLLVDSRGHIERANPVANRLLPEDILARPAQQLASYLIPASEPDYPLAPDDYWTAILNGGTPDFRVTLESPRGDRILSVRTHPLVYESGTKVVVLLQDVTDSVHRLQELTQFADIAAHDLRSPLTALYGLLEIAQDSTDLDEIQMLLARSQASARRMNDEIENWLTHAVARDGELQLQPLDLAPIIEELQHTYPSAKIEDKLTLKPLGDAVLIRQVVVNLVSNAVKYAPKGESPDIVVATAADLEPSMVRIEVRDQGTPLPPSEWVRIFEPYSRGAGAGLQASGTGMGLATCKRIVERHGGQISVTPNRDSAGVPIGNTFVFTLPVA
ncbi:MAG TPA: ATP-binding protein, partial [Marmoricola sp.]|nr:ATP-binding protein [Marmoricola sp.]